VKRFYKSVEVEAAGGGFAVLLDGRPVLTPARARLMLPTRALAEAVAAEWSAQGEAIRLEAMPLNRLAATAIDRMTADRQAVVAAVAAYARSDLLCYRAEGPAGLATRQALVWQPFLDWASVALDAPLQVTVGVVPVAQPPDALAAIARAVGRLDPWRLAAVQDATAILGSVVLALAMAAGRLTAEEAVDAAFLDEAFQAERWGEDAEARRRLDTLAGEVAAAARFLALLNGRVGKGS
jgi:chaperone required for assembly of F1-ATPase